MKKRNNIILFGTFWNEKDWIKPSLEQIEKINPFEVILCDGCFDERYPNKSTDGTREIIQEWASGRNNVQVISAVRAHSKIKSFLLLFRAHNKLPKTHYLYPTRFLSSLLGIRKNIYRINQALTFNEMISLSKQWKPGLWFMNYDCDQFYSDQIFSEFKSLDEDTSEILLTANEKTFLINFNSFTEEYDKRDFQNMPHKIFDNTTIVPTRDIYLEFFLQRKKYPLKYKERHVGYYYHYKIKSRDRFKKGYTLGDRKMPIAGNYSFKKISLEEHPSIIQKHYKKLSDRFLVSKPER